MEKQIDFEGIAHEIWVLAQLHPEEGILDGVDRIECELRRLFERDGSSDDPDGLYMRPEDEAFRRQMRIDDGRETDGA